MSYREYFHKTNQIPQIPNFPLFCLFCRQLKRPWRRNQRSKALTVRGWDTEKAVITQTTKSLENTYNKRKVSNVYYSHKQAAESTHTCRINASYAEDLGILYCFLRNWEASESPLWANILTRVFWSAPSLLLLPCASRPLTDLKSSINSRVCKQPMETIICSSCDWLMGSFLWAMHINQLRLPNKADTSTTKARKYESRT